MRTAWIVPLLVISVPLACSSNDGDDGNAAGSGGSTAAGSAGSSSAAGASGAAGSSSAAAATGRSGAATAAGRGAAGSSGAAGASGAAGSSSAAGASASAATGCEALCARPLVCPGGTRAACLSTCEAGAELCPAQSAALLTCGESLSDSDFQCVGEATIPNDNLCVTESAAFARCRIGF
jgi:hypothetical protein